MKITIKVNDSSYDVEVGDINARPIQATLDGVSYEVWPDEAVAENKPSAEVKAATPRPAPVVRTTPSTPQPGGDTSKVIVAPIPGVIITVTVKAGAQVSPGQEVCVLEAMKMKNSIKVTRSGTIGAVKINPGDHVQHGQILFEFTD